MNCIQCGTGSNFICDESGGTSKKCPEGVTVCAKTYCEIDDTEQIQRFCGPPTGGVTEDDCQTEVKKYRKYFIVSPLSILSPLESKPVL